MLGSDQQMLVSQISKGCYSLGHHLDASPSDVKLSSALVPASTCNHSVLSLLNQAFLGLPIVQLLGPHMIAFASVLSKKGPQINGALLPQYNEAASWLYMRHARLVDAQPSPKG